MSLNRVTLLGNVGKDPEIRTTQDGKKVANFSLATTERWKDKQGQRQEKTEWHRLVAFDPLATTVEAYVVKGGQLFVEGKLQTRKWTDAAGVEKYSTEIVAQNLHLLSRQAESKPQEMYDKEDDTPKVYDDEIPF